MNHTVIKAKDNLYNDGLCFTKGQTYTIEKYVSQPSGLMECYVINDLSERHQIGGWWREFTIVEHKH